MSDNTMAQFNTDGQNPFPVLDTENDNSADSPTVEETNIDQTQSEEGEQTPTENEDDIVENTTEDEDNSKKEDENIDNFADHPRWKQREGDWKQRFNDQEKRHTEEVEKIRKEMEEKFGDDTSKNSNVDLPEWWGGDEKQFKAFQGHLNSLSEKAKADAIAEMQSKSESDQKAIDDATNYFNDEVKELETATGETIDKNKLLKVVMDNQLVDTHGRWNYKAGYQLMKAGITSKAEKETNKIIDEKKKVAGASTSKDSSQTTKDSNVITSDDFADPSKRPW